MTLRKLGQNIKNQIGIEQTSEDTQNKLLNELRRLNDYMALMTDETSPPTEQNDTEEIT